MAFYGFILHQCLKYYRGEEKKINVNVKPFTRVESHFTNARFFEKDGAPKEIMSSTIMYRHRWHTKYPSNAKGRHFQTTVQEGRKQRRRYILFFQISR